ncbi:unnamed protein product [Albugo candida]|uniref:Uncharacterized protein n=1 Tax=Albugo candida TaxID=65357 RepID=A0A024GJE5_9STRA|nr:unnamed protein product [Albugo candida]|eukprot:CCI47000.1 unnamed protein product [Albugo candida]
MADVFDKVSKFLIHQFVYWPLRYLKSYIYPCKAFYAHRIRNKSNKCEPFQAKNARIYDLTLILVVGRRYPMELCLIHIMQLTGYGRISSLLRPERSPDMCMSIQTPSHGCIICIFACCPTSDKFGESAAWKLQASQSNCCEDIRAVSARENADVEYVKGCI